MSAVNKLLKKRQKEHEEHEGHNNPNQNSPNGPNSNPNQNQNPISNVPVGSPMRGESFQNQTSPHTQSGFGNPGVSSQNHNEFDKRM
jgi:hypothetical protein